MVTLLPRRRAEVDAGEMPSTPDPEVPEQAKRRGFTAAYKARVLAEADAGSIEGGWWDHRRESQLPVALQLVKDRTLLRIGLGLLSIEFLLQIAGACSRSDAESQTDSEFGETSTVVVQSAPEPSDTGTSEERRPPAVTVRGGSVELSLEAWTACWSYAGGARGECFVGPPPKVLLDIGSPSEVVVEFPVPG